MLKKVFIVFYGGGHVTMALPVINEFRNRGIDVVPLALTTASGVLKRKGIQHKSILDYVDAKNSDVRKYGYEILDRHHTDGKGISKEASLAYLGSSLLDAVNLKGYDMAIEDYRQNGLNSFCAVELMKSILKKEKPDFVIATPSPRMEKAALKASYELDIPSLCMVDLFAILEMPWLKNQDNGRYLTVFSEQVKKKLIDHGREPDRIFVTGNPAFDNLASAPEKYSASHYKSQKGIAGDKKIIFWADQPEPGREQIPKMYRERIAEICLGIDAQFVIRFHPSSTDETKETIPAGAIVSFPDEDLHEALWACDVVMTFTSTVAMEALLLGKKVIICKGSQYDSLVEYSPEIGSYICDSFGSLEHSILLTLDDSNHAKVLAENRKKLPRPGEAASRICDLVETISDDRL